MRACVRACVRACMHACVRTCVRASMRGVAWRGVAWRGVAWRGVAWRGVAWRGVAWRGVAWRGVAWRGVAWRGVAWRGVAWCGAWCAARGVACVSELFSVCFCLCLQKFEDHTQSDDEENRFSSFAQTAENTLMPSSDSDGECSHCDGKTGLSL